MARLDGQAQTRVKRAAFDFLTSPASPGLHLHRLVHAADRGFWSLRVSRDLRIIVHRGPGDAVLCYAGHHDEAYAWAAQRKLERRGLEGSPDELESLDVARERAHAGERGVEPAREPEVPSGAPAQSKVCAASRLERRLRLRVRAAGPLAASKTAPTSAGAPAPLLALLGAFVRSGGVRSEASSPDDRPRSPERDPSRGDPSQGPRHEARRRVGNIPPAAAFAAVAVLPGLAAFVLPLGARLTGAGGQVLVAALQAAVVALLACLLRWAHAAARARAQAQIARLAEAIRLGRPDRRLHPLSAGAEFRPLVEEVNRVLDALAVSRREATAPLTRLVASTARSRSEDPHDGLREERAAIRALADFFELRPDDIRSLVDSPRGTAGNGAEDASTERDGLARVR
ncbi:MAG TPA: hypothetical protein VFR85_11605 [Anaeromyxobacteraceae bacterium]|nr:hypothetical protein [Anaeromyxobacteraceae bacterium]